MKRIEFTTNRGTGFVEIPDDTISIRVPKGICENCEETETLEHGAVGVYQDEQADDDHKIVLPGGEEDTDHKIVLPGGEEDTEHLLPNIQ